MTATIEFLAGHTPAEWNTKLAASDAVWIGVGSPGGRDDLVAAANGVDDSTNALIMTPRQADPVPIWERLPSVVAACCRPPLPSESALFRRTTLIDAGGFADGHDSIWQTLCRQVSAGQLKFLEADADFNVESPLPEFAPTAPQSHWRWLREHINSLSDAELIGDGASSQDAKAVRAGLYQIHDDLDGSHELSQSVQGEGRHRAGDYWHAIMHRREPDASNSKYWFRRVGDHPLFDELALIASRLIDVAGDDSTAQWRRRLGLSDRWDPFAFVDLSEHCRRSQAGELATIARRIAWAEMLLLLDWSCRDCI